MKKSSIVTLVVALLAVGGTLMTASPGFRTVVWDKIHGVTGWSEDAIQKDPLGYMAFVEKKLSNDQNTIQATWRNLGVSVGKLAKKQTEKRELLARGMEFAEEFREAYQNASGVFPVEVRGESYTEAQLRSQLSLLLAQNDGLTQSLAEIDVAMNTADNRMEELIVQKEKIESQLVLIATKREMFHAEALSTEGLLLIAQLNDLFEGNQQAMAGNPVRSIEQLVKAETLAAKPANSIRVEQFLNANMKDKPSEIKIEDIVVTQLVSEEVVSVKVPKKVNKNRRSQKSESQPIYQQSI